MKKKIFGFLLILILFFTFACKEDEKKQDDNEQEDIPEENEEDTKEEGFVVTFVVDGEETTTLVKEGEKVDKPNDPNIKDCIFYGWYCDGEEYDFSKGIYSDLTISAKIHKKYDVNIDFDNYNFNIEMFKFFNGIYEMYFELENFFINNYKIDCLRTAFYTSVMEGRNSGIYASIFKKDNINEIYGNVYCSPQAFKVVNYKTFDILLNLAGDEELSTFPYYISSSFLYDEMIGNTILEAYTFSKNESEVVVDAGTDNEHKASALVYTGRAITYTKECAEYLLNRGLEKGLNTKMTYFEEADYYIVEGLKDENGKMVVSFGDGLNCDDSPCYSNPFLPFPVTINLLDTAYFSSRTESYHRDYEVETLSFEGSAIVRNQIERLFFGYANNSEDVESYYYPTTGKYKKSPIYFDYNGDGVYTEDEKMIYGGYQAKNIDENGNIIWLYDNKGRPIQEALDSEKIILEHLKVGYNAIPENMYIIIRIQLEYDKIIISIADNNIYDGASFNHGYCIDKIILFPYSEFMNIEEKVFYYEDKNKEYVIDINEIKYKPSI